MKAGAVAPAFFIATQIVNQAAERGVAAAAGFRREMVEKAGGVAFRRPCRLRPMPLR
jgi:hypothetical protein